MQVRCLTVRQVQAIDVSNNDIYDAHFPETTLIALFIGQNPLCLVNIHGSMPMGVSGRSYAAILTARLSAPSVPPLSPSEPPVSISGIKVKISMLSVIRKSRFWGMILEETSRAMDVVVVGRSEPAGSEV